MPGSSPPCATWAAAVAHATGWEVRGFPALASTNDEAARARDGGARRVVVVADRQHAGRGRGGHAFASPPGGLYASLVVAVPADAVPGPVGGATAVALAEALEALGTGPVEVKWPNDLRLAGRKVAGLLLEAGAARGGEVAVVVGVGVNVHGVPADLAPEVAARATAVADHAPAADVPGVLAGFLPRFDAAVGALATAEGRARLAAGYRARLALRGARVVFQVGREPRRGVLLDADWTRGLRVRAEDGSVTTFPAAHVAELREDPS